MRKIEAYTVDSAFEGKEITFTGIPLDTGKKARGNGVITVVGQSKGFLRIDIDRPVSDQERRVTCIPLTGKMAKQVKPDGTGGFLLNYKP